MEQSHSEIFAGIKPYIAEMIDNTGSGAGGTSGGGSLYRLKSVALNLASAADVTGLLPPGGGGTGMPSYAAGDLIYATAADTLARRAIGSANHLLTVAAGVPAWAALTDAMHGNLSGGALHAVATGALAGFMSAADKAKLDGFAASTVTGSGTAKRLALWTGAATIGDSANLYTEASAVGSYADMFVQKGETLLGSHASLMELYTGFEAQTPAILQLSSATAGGAGTHYAALVLAADHTSYVGPDAITGSLIWADRSRSTRLDAASISVIKDATYGARMLFAVASTSSSAPAYALQVLATGAVWLGYTAVASGDIGTLVGAGDFDIKGNLRVAGSVSHPLMISAAGTGLTVDNDMLVSGNLGIGITPTVPLHVQRSVSGGSGEVDAAIVTIVASQAVSTNYAPVALNFTARNTGAGNITNNLSGVIGLSDQSGAGAINLMRGVVGQIRSSGTGNGAATKAVSLVANTPDLSGDATITTLIGVDIANHGNADATSAVGAMVAEQSGAATNNANLVVGQTTAPSGTFSIYNSSTRNNYFAGSLGIGATSPAARLDIAAGAMRFAEMTAPSAPAANSFLLYADDSGGKTRAMILFSSGAAQQVAIQP